MAKIVLATFGSLGDLHPKIALGLELKSRGHDVTIAAMEYYREKIGQLGLNFSPLAPHLDPDNRELGKELMDIKSGTERIVRGLIMANLRQTFDDLMTAVDGADALVTGEIVYAAKSVVEIKKLKWVSTSLQPGSFLSAHDPFVPPMFTWFEMFRPLGSLFHRGLFQIMRRTIRDWYEPYKIFRKDLGLDPEHDPIFDGKFSGELHLALFSRVLGQPQPDWPANTAQAGFCFYDGREHDGKMPDALNDFLDAGEPPIVFTLGSAAVMDPGEFYEESIKAAKTLDRRAVLLYGLFNERPAGLTDRIAACDYAPFSLLFPRAVCVVHQGGVGTTGQVLRAGVPHLVMPYSHDQPDNAARCRRLGVAEIVRRDEYSAENAAAKIRQILDNKNYAQKAFEISKIVQSEQGTKTACDEIERVLESEARA